MVTTVLPEDSFVKRMFNICNVLIQLTAALAVHVHKLVEVEAGPLHHLHLPDVHIVEGVDA